MDIDDTIIQAARKGIPVQIIDRNGIEYVGIASHYIKADDEERGVSSICIQTEDKGGWCLFEDEIKSIRFYSMTQEQIHRFLYEECEHFDSSQSLDDYTEAICKYLTLCSWKYGMDEAKRRVSQYTDSIKEAYINKETVGDIAVDIGYCCG